MPTVYVSAQKADIYHEGWIDFNKNGTKDVYEDPKANIEERVADLMRQMTPEEKAGQLLTKFGWPLYERNGDQITLTAEAKKTLAEQGTGSLWGFMRADPWTQKTLTNGLNPEYAITATNLVQRYCIEHTRLGIPLLLAEECPHGHMAIGTTSFPTGIGQASTWNPDLLRQMGAAQAKEVRKQGGHIGYGPVVDLAKDSRWSRVEEGFGEDPFLAGELGVAVMQGMQVNEECPIISTVKHFTAYGSTEGGHNGGSAHLGETELNEQILPPFRKVVEAGLLSLMTSYNERDGVPCTGALNDFERMTKIAYAMVTYYGMSEKVGNLSYYNAQGGYDLTKPYSEKTAQLIDEEARSIIDEVTARTRKLLEANWSGVVKLAEMLIEKEVIMADDIEAIFGPKAGKHGEERLKGDDGGAENGNGGGNAATTASEEDSGFVTDNTAAPSSAASGTGAAEDDGENRRSGDE